MTNPLTLETFGVDLDALARRLADRQTELGRDDDACAKLAGVTVERWAAWKDGRERPGVGRVPRLAAAVDASPGWILYGVATDDSAPASIEAPTYDARRALELLNQLAPMVETAAKVSAEIARHGVPIPGGQRMGDVLEGAAIVLRDHDALSAVAFLKELRAPRPT